MYFFLQAEKCSITEGIQNALTIGEEYCITVNTKGAGRGAVTCRIRSTSDAGRSVNFTQNLFVLTCVLKN
jgi:filamin